MPDHLPRSVFPTQRGHHRRETKAPRGWNKPTRQGTKSYLELAGLHVATAHHDGRPVRWHDLRHTCGASLISGWWGRRWSMIEVRDQLGHKNIKTTQRYAHLGPDVRMAAARGTAGRPLDMPAACPRPMPAIGQVREMISRATLDSNQWPSASEAEENSQIQRGSPLNIAARAWRGHVEAREVHERAQAALEAIAAGDRFAVRRAIEALEVARDFAADLLAGEAAPAVDPTSTARAAVP